MIITIISILLIISFLVFIHEFGHYITALKFGMKVEEFAIGMGPALFKFTSKKTGIIYSLRAVPIGGFCKIKGEDGDHESSIEDGKLKMENEDSKNLQSSTFNPQSDNNSFASKKIWQRAVVLSAGVFMNFVLTVILTYIGFLVGNPEVINPDNDYSRARMSQEEIKITSILKDSPAHKSNIENGSELISINGQKFNNSKEILIFLSNNTTVSFTIKTAKGEIKTIDNVKKEFNKEADKEIYGISFDKIALVKYGPLIAIPKTIETIISYLGQMISGLGHMISSIFTFKGIPEGLAGPIGIAVITGEVVKLGFSHVLQFVAVLSLNLALINIMPFPALDGGRLFFLLIEKIKGSKLNEKFEVYANMTGFILLIALIIAVTFNDVGTFIIRQ